MKYRKYTERDLPPEIENDNSIYRSIKIEDSYDVNELDIGKLERESDNLVMSIARSDRLLESIVHSPKASRLSGIDNIFSSLNAGQLVHREPIKAKAAGADPNISNKGKEN